MGRLYIYYTWMLDFCLVNGGKNIYSTSPHGSTAGRIQIIHEKKGNRSSNHSPPWGHGTQGWHSKNRGTPKWMVKIMENPMNKWMIWGYHYFRKHPYKVIAYQVIQCLTQRTISDRWRLLTFGFRGHKSLSPTKITIAELPGIFHVLNRIINWDSFFWNVSFVGHKTTKALF